MKVVKLRVRVDDEESEEGGRGLEVSEVREGLLVLNFDVDELTGLEDAPLRDDDAIDFKDVGLVETDSDEGVCFVTVTDTSVRKLELFDEIVWEAGSTGDIEVSGLLDPLDDVA